RFRADTRIIVAGEMAATNGVVSHAPSLAIGGRKKNMNSTSCFLLALKPGVKSAHGNVSGNNPCWSSMDLTELFRRKTLDKFVGDSTEPQHQLKRVLGPVQLTALGVGAAIGAGIFSSIGSAVAGGGEHTGAGPAIIISFIL